MIARMRNFGGIDMLSALASSPTSLTRFGALKASPP